MKGVAPVEKDWHSWTVSDCVAELNSNPDGLALGEVAERQRVFGPNLLAEGTKVSLLTVFFNQFRDFMILVLLAATLISGLLGEYTDAITIIAIIILNGILGFVQEVRAERSLAALKELTAPMAKVRRQGQVTEVPARDLVPGDVVLLEDGDRVPADGRIMSCTSFSVEESTLTGESVPVNKQPDLVAAASASLGDRKNMVYMGTMVTRGKAEVLVVATAMDTEMGKIADLMEQSEETVTPLQRRLEELGKFLVWLAIVLTVLVVVTGVLHGHPWVQMFLAGVSLAVAAIPEGLPAIVTIALALGVQRMIKRNAIVRKLPSVETLGCATVICSDKTGTLTQNRMTVQHVYADGVTYQVSGTGYDPHGQFLLGDQVISPSRRPALKSLVEIGAVCNNAVMVERPAEDSVTWTVQGDPTEGALLVLAAKAGFLEPDAVYHRVAENPFDSERKCMSVLVQSEAGVFAFVKGAPDILLNMSKRVLSGGKEQGLTPSIRKTIQTVNEQFASSALRNLGFAYRQFPSLEVASQANWEDDLVFVGMCGMIDPPRDEVYEAIETCRRAGVRTVMITGDHQQTAAAIAKRLCILPEGGEILTGAMMDEMDDHELAAAAKKTCVYARVTPEHKLRIVRALQAGGEIVAMTGDGVNDAPAIKQSDIGIAMGKSGTDVAKEASALVLADDNFATIVAAIEEGRGIYDNIKKFIRYLLASNVGEILTMFIAMLMGLPLPLLPIQILWVNLVTDGLPAIALGVDPIEKDIMHRPPRNVHEGIFAKGMATKILSRGTLIGLSTLAVFLWVRHAYPDNLALAQTMAYATLTMSQLILVFDCRSLDGGIFKRNLFGNLWLIFAVLSSVAMFLATVYVEPLAKVFSTVPLSLSQWVIVLVMAAIPTFALSLRRAGRNAIRPKQAEKSQSRAA
ncbi:calcium-translocating P-type ATPase, SERCA-type [Alicyclobacillus sp. SP_1]|uniref:calcium-translocating P-type ATPase, SERCA-type n=1 Tax=Alicyclobacillus sp. SP_1 TaxID=2942475 RepID=UPI00215892A0|nr:calcium-translocating P-type ATPase, SERCA-type [Alicyclobacillus sp. SP_1]